MATVDFNKENLFPLDSGDALGNGDRSPTSSKGSRRGRSKSIGPGALNELSNARGDLEDRRKSLFLPATRSILSKNEDAQKAARRRTMGNRRVSFAPEATLHTWDVIELGRDQTTSTDSPDSTRRNSHLARSASPDSDGEDDGSSPSRDGQSPASDARKSRRNSGVVFSNTDDVDSSSIASGESGSDEDEDDGSGSDEEEDEGGSEDDTGTAMSLDTDDNTVRSAAESEGSTGSSARLEAALRQAAQTAGTRGIEFDEYGDMSMEIAGEEITNAFKPWTQGPTAETTGSTLLDQENINPFLPGVKAPTLELRSGGSDDDDMSMDMTHAVGGIMGSRQVDPESSPFGDATMDMTQAVGKITTQKRRRSTAETGSPGVENSREPSKRRRSSGVQSSASDDPMDLTMAVGGIHSTDPPVRQRRTRNSLTRRRMSGVASQVNESTATMDFTRAIGGIKAATSTGDDGSDENEELSMELTTVFGGIKPSAQDSQRFASNVATPQIVEMSPAQASSPISKSQDRLDEKPEEDFKKSLSPIAEAQTPPSNRRTPRRKSRTPSPTKITSPVRRTPFDSNDKTPETDNDKSSARKTASPATPVIAYPDLTSVNHATNSESREHESTSQQNAYRTPESDVDRQLDSQSKQQGRSPMVEKQQRSTPVTTRSTPERPELASDGRSLVQSIKLMSTPRKETLKTVSPQKQTPVKSTAPQRITPRTRATPKVRADRDTSSAQQLKEDLATLQSDGKAMKKVGLQEFLDTAGIRFMDLTATKRRVTTVSTPAKSKAIAELDGDDLDEDVTLESSIVAAACTAPELDLYRHACHELKRYMKEGKQMVAELEAATADENPPLIQAYVNASTGTTAALDAQMRDMKANARLRSKELWYSWRSKLLDELMVGLQKIGEGLIKDDEQLTRAEEILDSHLPGLAAQQDQLQAQAARLEETANTMTDEEKEEMQSLREELVAANSDLEEKRRILDELRQETQEQDDQISELNENKLEFTAAIQEANRVREACRGISLSEVTALKDSVKHLEDTYGWAITAASSSPSTVTMAYNSQLELTFQPSAFQRRGDGPNAPIRLSYIADASPDRSRSLATSLRFFLQLLRAALQALPQCTTRIADLLALVSDGWGTALALAETERRLALEAPTHARIVGDERLDVHTAVLLPSVRTKVQVTFALTAWVGRGARDGAEDGSDDAAAAALRLHTSAEPLVTVVYGEEYHEKNMTEFMKGQMGAGVQDWDCALQEIRAKLVARGVKGTRKQ